MAKTHRERSAREGSGRSREVDLLRRIADGDRAAFSELYQCYYPRLFRFLMRITGRPEVAEEVVDDVLVVVWRKAADFERRSRVSTWIFGIAYRQGLRALRRRRRRGGADSRVDLDWEQLAGDESPERDLARRERADRMGRALSALPPKQRAVVELAYHHELPYPEIAEIVGCPVGTVKSRMFHARRRLRKMLPELGGRSKGSR